jgi:hypothetical protein
MVYDLIVASNWGYTLRPHSSNSTDRLPNGAFGVLPKKEFFFLAGSANFGGQSADLPANLTDFFFPNTQYLHCLRACKTYFPYRR